MTRGLPEASKLTIFTVLRDFDNVPSEGDQTRWLEELHTYNAIGSWLRLPSVEVLLFGITESCQLAAQFFDSFPNRPVCRPIPCVDEVYGTPKYDCLFGEAANLSVTEFIM